MDPSLVVQRLAHAHEDDVADGAALCDKLPVRLDDLVEDFIAAKILGQTHLTCRAEPAAHGATDLTIRTGKFAQT
jgi:hypothetical protein